MSPKQKTMTSKTTRELTALHRAEIAELRAAHEKEMSDLIERRRVQRELAISEKARLAAENLSYIKTIGNRDKQVEALEKSVNNLKDCCVKFERELAYVDGYIGRTNETEDDRRRQAHTLKADEAPSISGPRPNWRTNEWWNN